MTISTDKEEAEFNDYQFNKKDKELEKYKQKVKDILIKADNMGFDEITIKWIKNELETSRG